MILVELIDHRASFTAKHADPDLALFQVLSHLHFADRHQTVVPFIILLDHIADFTAEEFIDTIEAALPGMGAAALEPSRASLYRYGNVSSSSMMVP